MRVKLLEKNQNEREKICNKFIEILDIDLDDRHSTITVPACVTAMKLLKEHMNRLTFERDRIMKHVNEGIKKYKDKQIADFNKAVTAQRGDLISRQRIERGPAVVMAAIGGITAYTWTNAVNKILSSSTKMLVNGIMKLGFVALNLISLGNSISRCAMEAADEGNWIPVPSNTDDDTTELVHCNDQRWGAWIKGEKCSSRESIFTCEKWSGVNIDEYTNIKMLATIGGITISGLATWWAVRNLTFQTKIMNSSSMGLIIKVGAVGIPAAIESLQPSAERRALDERVVSEQVIRGPIGTLQTKSELLKNLTEEYYGTQEYIEKTKQLSVLNSQIYQCNENMKNTIDTILCMANEASKRQDELTQLQVEATRDVMLALTEDKYSSKYELNTIQTA